MKRHSRKSIRENKRIAYNLYQQGLPLIEIMMHLQKGNGKKYSPKSYSLIWRWITEAQRGDK